MRCYRKQICSVCIAGDETIADDTTLLESTLEPSSASVIASAADAVSASTPSSTSAPMAEGMSTCHAERIMSNSMASISSQADNLSGAQWTAVRGAGTVQTPCIVCRSLIQYVIARWQNFMANVTEYACHDFRAVCNKQWTCGSWYYCLWLRLMLLHAKQAYACNSAFT